MASDRDYGCNASDPECVIAVILDDAGRAKEIIDELNALGFVIVRAAEQIANITEMRSTEP